MQDVPEIDAPDVKMTGFAPSTLGLAVRKGRIGVLTRAGCKLPVKKTSFPTLVTTISNSRHSSTDSSSDNIFADDTPHSPLKPNLRNPSNEDLPAFDRFTTLRQCVQEGDTCITLASRHLDAVQLCSTKGRSPTKRSPFPCLPTPACSGPAL